MCYTIPMKTKPESLSPEYVNKAEALILGYAAFFHQARKAARPKEWAVKLHRAEDSASSEIARLSARNWPEDRLRIQAIRKELVKLRRMVKKLNKENLNEA